MQRKDREVLAFFEEKWYIFRALAMEIVMRAENVSKASIHSLLGHIVLQAKLALANFIKKQESKLSSPNKISQP